MVLAAAGFIALAVFFAARALLAPRRDLAGEQLARLGGSRAGGTYGAEEGDTLVDRVMRPMASGFAHRIAALLPTRVAAHYTEKLTAAGRPVSRGPFLATLVIMPPAFALFGLLVMLRSGASPAMVFLGVLVLGGFGLAIPTVWLRGRVTRRQTTVNRDLPDFLDLIVVSVEAGLGLEGAIGRVAETKEGPLAEELRRVLADMNLGMGRRRALQGLVARTQVPAISSLVSAIIQAEQTGMGIGQILRTQSDQLRTQRRQHAEEAAMKAPLKMLFPLLFFIFPSLFVVVLGPAMLNFMQMMSSSE